MVIGGDEPGLTERMESLYTDEAKVLEAVAPRWFLAGRIVGTVAVTLIGLVLIFGALVGLALLARVVKDSIL